MKLIHILIVVSVLEVSLTEAAYRIRNGQEVRTWSETPYKFVALVQGKKEWCTGSLISSVRVLTAAQCVLGGDLSASYFKVDVKESHYNSKYKYCDKDKRKPSGYDVAMVYLKERIQERITVCHLNFDQAPKGGQQVVMIGYGMEKHQGDKLILRSGDGKVMGKCNVPEFKDSPICVESYDNTNIQHIFKGDSGGPLVDYYHPSDVLGVASGHLTVMGIIDVKSAISAYAGVKKNEGFIKNHL